VRKCEKNKACFIELAKLTDMIHPVPPKVKQLKFGPIPITLVETSNSNKRYVNIKKDKLVVINI